MISNISQNNIKNSILALFKKVQQRTWYKRFPIRTPKRLRRILLCHLKASHFKRKEKYLPKQCRQVHASWKAGIPPPSCVTSCSQIFRLSEEYVPSEEQFNDITAAGKELFQRLVKAKYDVNSLNQLEQKELHLRRNFSDAKNGCPENSDDGQLWKYILSGLGYDELQSAPSWQSCYKKMTELLRLSVRYFADYGQKYYNTLRIQSLAPADSISELFEIIYSFIKTIWNPSNRSPSFFLCVWNCKLFSQGVFPGKAKLY